jgi:hypothetical protein
MSYEEEDTCHMRRRIHVRGYKSCKGMKRRVQEFAKPYEEKDTCHVRRRIHVV